MAFLELSGISKHFGAIQALTNVSLSLKPGEVVGLMGDNGAGKSTLVKIVAGNYPPSSGTIEMQGRKVIFHKPADARAEGIEIVYQDLALCDNLTAAANVFLGRELELGLRPFRVLNYRTMYQRTAAISVRQVAEVLSLIRRLRDHNITVVLISHRMPDVFAVANRIVVLRRGAKVADKSISDSSPEEVTGLITGAI